MNAAALLRSNTILATLSVSSVLSLSIFLFTADGLPALRKRRAELRDLKVDLIRKTQSNQELLEEVRRLSVKDPETLEALARKQGYQKPGEHVYIYGGRRSQKP